MRSAHQPRAREVGTLLRGTTCVPLPLSADDQAMTFTLTLSVDSYNKLDGTMEWIAWYDEDDTPRRTLPLSGEYDSRTGRFAIRFDLPFRREAKIVQVLNVPLASGGSREERVEVVEVKLDHPTGQLAGAVDGATDARGTLDGAWLQGISVDGKDKGSGSHALRGTFLINPEGILLGTEANWYNFGRNIEELMRKFKASMYLAKKPSEACPSKWKDEGDKTLVNPGADMVGKVHEALNK